MVTLAVPYHLDGRLEHFDCAVPVDSEITAELPRGTPWERMAVLYDAVAAAVSRLDSPPLVVTGDCTTSLGILAGLQRGGGDPGIVWFDGHADFHTEATTTSGYLGGLPLALAAGVGTLTLPGALGLRPVPESRIVLVDARDTDPGEHVLLRNSAVTRTAVRDVDAGGLPEGEIYLHVDLDVCDPTDVPDLLFPAPGGPTVDDVVAAIGRVAAAGRVTGACIAATWHHRSPGSPVHRDLVQRVAQAAAGG
ncbi:MAG: arginase family protein [Mycobacteriales bacterium]